MSLFLDQALYISRQAPIDPRWGGLGASPWRQEPGDFHVLQIPNVAALLSSLPASADRTPWLGPPYNQGSEGSCVAYSWCGACSLDENQEQGRWPLYDGHGLYRALGGVGNSGIDSRACAQYLIRNGTPLLAGGTEKVIGSFASVTQAPQVFREQVFASVAAGQSVKLALLLPTDWGWQSGHGSVTQAYHEVVVVGYRRIPPPDYFVIFNTWGPWGLDGRGIGSVLCDYCEAEGNQHGLCYAETSTSLLLGPSPPPPPPPALGITQIVPANVGPGARVQVRGSGFQAAGLRLFWDAIWLSETTVSDSEVTILAPLNVTGTFPVVAERGAQRMIGPNLTISNSAPPPPPPMQSLTISGAQLSWHGRHDTVIVQGQNLQVRAG